MNRMLPFAVLSFVLGAGPLLAQTASGTVRGAVLDPSGAAIKGAAVQIQNTVAHYEETAATDEEGTFHFDNLPINNYSVIVIAEGFQIEHQNVDVRSTVPVQLKFNLVIGPANTSVTVEAGGDLVESEPSTHTDINRQLIEKLPLGSPSSALSSLVTLASPGVAADSNGMFHGLGDHAQNSFSVDGQPITDQQSKAFSNQLPVNSVQSMQVIEGAPPAEYGDKTSLVVVVTTRSGLDTPKPHGSVYASYGNFGTATGGFDAAYGHKRWGNFLTLDGMNTRRFLDGPELAVMHDHGNQGNFFDRFDYKPAQNDTLSLNLGLTRSWFQTPNSYDMQNAAAWNGLVVNNGGLGPNGLPVGPTDQRAKIRTFNIAPSWTRVIGTSMMLSAGLFARQDQFHYYPSGNPFADFVPDLQTMSVGQSRRLTNLGGHADLSYLKGKHNIKGGLLWENTILTEADTFGIVDPAFNSVCLNADGSPNTNPLITNAAGCTGALRPNPGYNPLLGCYDLTRTGTARGCPNSATAPYTFNGHANVRELALFLEDTITKNNWTFRLGLRGDFYNGITRASEVEPRLGAAYRIKRTSTVLQASYARTMETPFNENLVLSSLGCNDPVVGGLMATQQGYPCLSAPLRPGWRNEYHLGLQQAFGRYFVVSGEYIWKYTHRAYDFSIFANTPVAFPIEWARSKIPGYAIRVSMPEYHGLSAYVVMSSVAARFFGPQVSGIGVTPSSAGVPNVFRIDHDEVFNQTAHVQYQPKKEGPWIGFTWRFDSGMVAGPVPCAGGNCNNGPNGTATVVDVSGLTPDQQFQAGLSCGGVHATPTMGISPSGLCPAGQYGSSLMKIPAAGTENADHNPPRIASRNLFDIAVGHDNLFHAERYKWSARLAVVNLSNQNALYNFLSTFSGTHYVQPRAVTLNVAFHF